MFRNGKIVCLEANPENYHTQDAKPGEAPFVMSSGTLLDFGSCPARWIAGRDRAGAGKRWRGLLETLHLTPSLFDARYAVRPDTYQVRTLKCPSCGSESEAAVCRRCGLRRANALVQRPWAGMADYCRKWTAEAERKHQLVLRAEEHQDALAAAARLQADPVIASWLAGSDVQVWVAAEWVDAETGLVIPVRTMIQYVPRSGTEWDRSLGALRTTRDASQPMWRRQCYYARAHVRAAWCLDLYLAATGDARTQFYFVLSENLKPFEPGRRSLGPTFLQLGRRTYETLLGHYCQCLAHKLWPSYDLTNQGPDAWTPVETEPWMHQGDPTSSTLAPLPLNPDTEPAPLAA